MYLPSQLKLEVMKTLAAKSTGSQLQHTDENTSVPVPSTGIISVTVRPQPIRAGDPVQPQTTGSLLHYAQGTGRQNLKIRGDHATMRLLVAAGLPPGILDYPEWKQLCAVLNAAYQPLNRTMFKDVILPAEQAHVQSQQLELLRTQRYLTITYDGGTTRRHDGHYTIHVCTPSGQDFFVEMINGRGVSHTADWIFEHLAQVCEFQSSVFERW